MPNPSKAYSPRKVATKKNPMRLSFLPVNGRWVVTWGDQIIPIASGDSGPDYRSFESKKEALAILKKRGLKVGKTGVLST
jgi:hypothetical protein